MELTDKQQFDLDFQAIAADWHAALSPTAYTPYSYEEVRNRLANLAQEATTLLYEETYQPENAERIGAAIAELHYIQGNVLGHSIKLLSSTWLSGLPVTENSDKHKRMTMLLGDMANGYYRSATNTILHHQEEIREAQLATLRDLHADIQNQRDLLHLTAERLQTLHDIDSGILAAQSAEAIAEIAVEHILRLIPCHSAIIMTVDFARKVFVVLASENTPRQTGELISLSLTTKLRLQKLANDKSLKVNDIGALRDQVPALEDSYSRGMNSILTVPLLAMRQLIGVLGFESTEIGAFTDHHEVIARQIANSVAVALYNRRLLETEKKAHQVSETLRDVAASLSSSLEREELLDYILVQLDQVVPFDGTVILLQTEGRFQVVAQRGFNRVIIESLNNLDELPANMRQIIAQRAPVIVSDTHEDPDWISLPGSEHVRCWLGAPLISQGELIGILAVDKYEPDFYEQSAANIVQAFANQAAIAIENARLYHEVQQSAETLRDSVAARTRDLEALYEIAAITSQPLELQTILQVGLQRTLDDLKCESAAIHMLDKDNEHLNLVEQHNLDSNQIDQIRQISSNNPLLHRLLVDQETITTPDISADPRFHAGTPPAITKSYAATPIRARGEVCGIISLYCEEAHIYSKDDIKLFASIADHLGIAIDNANLQKQAEQAAVVGERERLARELHDSATQSLFSLTLFAAAAREKVLAGQFSHAIQHLDDIRYTANQTHREMRLLLHELGQPEPDDEGLIDALERRLRAVEGRSGINATFRSSYSGELGAEMEKALYQIATEALNNALKYAAGTSVIVEITADDTRVILSVKDNGNGFDLVEARKGAGRGLTNMSLRAGSMGGTLSIETSIGHGTEIVAIIPTGTVG